jgi:hypothetical protein
VTASFRETLCDVPFRLAITETAVVVVTVVAFNTKLALEAPAATVTVDGIVTAGTTDPSFNATLDPPAGAALVRLTVHVAEPGGTIDVGVHVIALIATNGQRARE